MSAPHPAASAATTKGLIDIADNLDDCLLAFHCVSDLLTVFSEQLEEELRFLKLSNLNNWAQVTFKLLAP